MSRKKRDYTTEFKLEIVKVYLNCDCSYNAIFQ